ncbi:TPA: phage tail terminator protein [Pseudomonas aeruginosa]
MSDPFDYLFLEQLLVDRIQAEVPGLAGVEGLPDLATLGDQSQASPCVYVIYLGDQIDTGASAQGGSRGVQFVVQHWAAVLTVYYADAQGDGQGARRLAGPLLGRLLKALTGWVPALDVAALARSPQAAQVGYANGYFYFPLVFTARFVYPRIKSWQP